MKFKVLKPHVHDCVEYGKGDIRDNVEPNMVVHLVKKGVIERAESAPAEKQVVDQSIPVVVETGNLEE